MILDGRKVRDELLDKYQKEIERDHLDITLAIIFVGSNQASELYINNKVKYCQYVGIKTNLIKYDQTVSENEIIQKIIELNNDANVTGIIVQSPVPEHINYDNCIKYINPQKDIDGFTKDSFYALGRNIDGLRPCTVKGIMKLLEYYHIDVAGKRVCIIGRGNIVGKPLALEMLNHDATVTVCHSKTKHLRFITQTSDIVVCAVGKKHFLKADMVRIGSTVIDVGITVENSKIYGDVEYKWTSRKAKNITPNPGGVGPMTIAMIIENLIEAKKSGK